MASMDIFNQGAFSIIELTRALEKTPYRPGLLGSTSLFQFHGIRTRTFAIEERNGILSLIDFSDPDGPGTQEDGAGEERVLRDFRTRHFKKSAIVRASELAGIRAFGSETEMMQVQAEIARKGQKLRNDAELTFEYHRLNALQGVVRQPSTGDIVYNWFTAFGIDPPAEIDFDLDNAAPAKGAFRKKCFEVLCSMEDSVGGLVPGSMVVEAICGRDFWRDLTSHPEVMEAYSAAMKFAEMSSKPADVFEWGGILWRRYRGGSGVGVHVDKCHLYPTGIDGLFEHYGSPAEDMDLVGSVGAQTYYRIIPDRDRNQWVKFELEANPMMICTRPGLLRQGRRT